MDRLQSVSSASPTEELVCFHTFPETTGARYVAVDRFEVGHDAVFGARGSKREQSIHVCRVTHFPTGISVLAREERSQHANRKLALARLADILLRQSTDKKRATERQLWDTHNELERGNPVRVFQQPI